MTPIRPELLEILVCPVPACHGNLQEQADRLVCLRCGLRYRIEQSWPVLIPEEADPPAGGGPPEDAASPAAGK
ncbi:hypothetical protein RAS1_34810 [Phycisphaerae bacterium RAS1]|nr:hypothetical protein RAS1_34810 [Phycisphaerae bacterium RAS1]